MAKTGRGALHSILQNIWSDGALSLDHAGDTTPETWFIGPRGENAELFERLIIRALRHNIDARQTYQPQDPRIFPESQSHPMSEAFLSFRVDEVLHWLRGSIPLSSHRNVSHMYWDQALPALVGYVAALLYNQNNVAAEAAPVTTLFEIKVGDDLCRMLGYAVPERGAPSGGQPCPWGHITCDGSVANIEAVWAARNARYLGITLAASLRDDPAHASLRDCIVRCADGEEARLLDLDDWRLINLPLDALTALVQTLHQQEPKALDAAMARHSVQWLGLVEFHRTLLPHLVPPVLFVPQTAHYSWPKAAALTGLGDASLRRIPIDLDGRMDIGALEAALQLCLQQRQPVVQVTAVMGTTEESAVDPLHEILHLRDGMRRQGLDFAVHADAAWGGYFASMLRRPGDKLRMRYRGILPEFTVTAGHTYAYGTAVLSSADALTPENTSLDMSVTPDSLLIRG